MDAQGAGDGSAIQPQIPLSYIAQSPVYGLTNEVTVVPGFALDDLQKFFELRVDGKFVPVLQVSYQCKSCAFLEFILVARPKQSAGPCGLGENEEMATGAVANIPIVKVARPQIHVRRRDLARIGDEAGKNSRIVVSSGPENQS